MTLKKIPYVMIALIVIIALISGFMSAYFKVEPKDYSRPKTEQLIAPIGNEDIFDVQNEEIFIENDSIDENL